MCAALTRRTGMARTPTTTTLSVRSGELLGILGPNGAGKTTLVRRITTEFVPTSGDVRVFGIDSVAYPNPVKGLMGVMPCAMLRHSRYQRLKR